MFVAISPGVLVPVVLLRGMVRGGTIRATPPMPCPNRASHAISVQAARAQIKLPVLKCRDPATRRRLAPQLIRTEAKNQLRHPAARKGLIVPCMVRALVPRSALQAGISGRHCGKKHDNGKCADARSNTRLPGRAEHIVQRGGALKVGAMVEVPACRRSRAIPAAHHPVAGVAGH